MSKRVLKKIYPYILGLLTIFIFFSPFMPLTPSAYSEFFSDNYGMPDKMDIVVGESKVIQVANPQRLAIGNPEVADVVGASKEELLISAVAAGETNLQIWDDFGKREIFVRVFDEDLGKLKLRLEDLFETANIRGVTFRVGDTERKIFVLGKVPVRRQEIFEQLLENFDEKLINLVEFKEEKPLVEIDVQIMEIQKTVIDKLGINWTQAFSFNESTAGQPHSFIRQVGDMSQFFGTAQMTRNAISATLSVLETDNLARTLARPKLVALSGKEAEFLVGGEIPILSSVSTTSGTTTTAIDYVEYGVSLSILPEVKESGGIQCQLEVEIKSIDHSTALTVPAGSNTTTTPGFKSRKATTELYLENEQTAFLAGLINNDESNNLQRFPGLAQIPVFGILFRSKEFQLGDTELVISITPKIVNYGDMRQDIATSALAKKGYLVDAEIEPVERYVRAVQELVLGHVSYPMEARRTNLSGTVALSLHLLSNGQLVGAVVSTSSGHKLLDNAALFTAKRMAPYPSFPEDLQLKEIWIEIPIAYQID